MKLRPYQEEAKAAVYRYFKEKPGKNPCVVLPTGAGKTPVLASICKDVVVDRAKVIGKRQRVLILSHVKELLEQAVDKIKTICPELSVGVFSAGLKSRDVEEDVIVAGIQSVYRRAYELGRFDVIIVDEAHLIPLSGDGMYQTFLNDARVVNPSVRVVGLTATPFRTKAGSICSETGFLNDVCYEVGVPRLIEEGYLSPIKTRAVVAGMDTSNLKIKMGEFVQSEVDELVGDVEKVDAVCSEIVMKAHKFGRKKVLLFAANVSHAETIKDRIERISGEECGIVTGATPAAERAYLLKRFKDGAGQDSLLGGEAKPLKYLVNVNVLTTGFDNPKVDLVALIRPTASPGLYYQMVGRGFRIHPEKDYCLILDFGQNIERHGPVDALCVKTSRQGSGGTAPVKTCPRCELVTLASARVCPDCGFEFPIVTAPEKVDFRSSRLNILSSEPGLRVRPEDLTTIGEHEVFKTTYFKHRKLVDGAPTYSLRVHYETAEREYREWVCPEHYGYARQKFEKWWAKRSPVAPPDTVDATLASIENDGFAPTLKITVRKKPGDAYEEIVKYELGEKPDSFDFAEPDSTAPKCVDCLSYRRGRCYLNPDAPKDAPPSLKACSSYCLESDIPF